jgi:hypothetical protein
MQQAISNQCDKCIYEAAPESPSFANIEIREASEEKINVALNKFE